jgi:hypothetical protein
MSKDVWDKADIAVLFKTSVAPLGTLSNMM